MVRHPLTTVRDAVSAAGRPRRALPARAASPPDTSDPRDTPDTEGETGTAADAGAPVGDERAEDLAAMRQVEDRLGGAADPADRATRSANAYLAARRRRLRRQLEACDR